MKVIIVLIMLHMSVLNARFLLVDLEADDGKQIDGQGLNLMAAGGRSSSSSKKGYKFRL